MLSEDARLLLEGVALCNQKKIVERMVQRHQNKPADVLPSERITLCSTEELCCLAGCLDVTHTLI